jgi:hypothetical protein
MCRSLTYVVALVLMLGIVGKVSAAVSSIAGSNITTRANSNSSWTGRVTSRLVDGSGLSPGGTYGIHGYRFDDAWMVFGSASHDNYRGGTPDGPAWVEFEFNRAYDLGVTWVWNMVQITSRGLRNVSVHYSMTGSTTNPGDWTKLGDFEFPKVQGSGHPGPDVGSVTGGFEAFNFDSTRAKFVVITAHDVDGNWSGRGMGFSEILFIPEPATLALLGLGGIALLRRNRKR